MDPIRSNASLEKKEGLINFYMILNTNSIFFQKVGNPIKVGKMAALYNAYYEKVQ